MLLETSLFLYMKRVLVQRITIVKFEILSSIKEILAELLEEGLWSPWDEQKRPSIWEHVRVEDENFSLKRGARAKTRRTVPPKGSRGRLRAGTDGSVGIA